MTLSRVVLGLDDRSRQYEPGDVLAGQFSLDGVTPSDVDALELSVLWYTEGKGDEDMSVHFFRRTELADGEWDDFRQPRRFSTILPNSPLSYHGLILRIRWCVRVRVFLRAVKSCRPTPRFNWETCRNHGRWSRERLHGTARQPVFYPLHPPRSDRLCLLRWRRCRSMSRLERAAWRGQIVGPHGSGKSTLLASLLPYVVQSGRHPLLFSLHDHQRRMPRGWRREARRASKALVIIDGYEQLSAFQRLGQTGLLRARMGIARHRARRRRPARGVPHRALAIGSPGDCRTVAAAGRSRDQPRNGRREFRRGARKPAARCCLPSTTATSGAPARKIIAESGPR